MATKLDVAEILAEIDRLIEWFATSPPPPMALRKEFEKMEPRVQWVASLLMLKEKIEKRLNETNG